MRNYFWKVLKYPLHISLNILKVIHSVVQTESPLLVCIRPLNLGHSAHYNLTRQRSQFLHKVVTCGRYLGVVICFSGSRTSCQK